MLTGLFHIVRSSILSSASRRAAWSTDFLRCTEADAAGDLPRTFGAPLLVVGGDLLREGDMAFFAGVRPRARARDLDRPLGDEETSRVRLTGRSFPVDPLTVSASVLLRFSVAFPGLLPGAGDLLLAIRRSLPLYAQLNVRYKFYAASGEETLPGTMNSW